MIQIKDLAFSYPGSSHRVFDGLSLELEENRIYGLLGKNGTGKSSLLYLISGLLRPSCGSVQVDGVEARKRAAAMLEDTFIVPEELELPAVSLDTYVSINRPFYPRFSREVLDSCLSDFDLPASLELGELSMGQKKKVYTSLALAAGTKLLLMDEPTNGLDIPSKSQFRRVVANNMSDERTLIISTHQVHDVEQLLDHILILGETGLVLNASVADICRDYTFELRSPQEMDSTVVYAEPSLHGNAVMARRQPESPETSVNLELLFNAVVTGKV